MKGTLEVYVMFHPINNCGNFHGPFSQSLNARLVSKVNRAGCRVVGVREEPIWNGSHMNMMRTSRIDYPGVSAQQLRRGYIGRGMAIQGHMVMMIQGCMGEHCFQLNLAVGLSFLFCG